MTDPAVRASVEGLLGQIATVPHVLSAPSPYGQPGAIAADGRILQATVQLDAANPDAMPVEDTQRIIDLASAADRSGLDVALGGQVVEAATQGSIGSEGIGLAAAAIILLLVFGSVVAAGLPILVAVVGLGVSASLVGVVAAFVDVPDWSTSLAAMMGIGVGVDYVLLLVTRYREYLGRGLTPRGATMATADTAGRAVLVAGSTVVVSLLGLFGMGLSAMRGAALVTILAVLIVMLAAVTLLPALFGFVGHRSTGCGCRCRARPGGRSGPAGPSACSAGRWIALGGGLVLLALLAAPFLGVRYGFPDAGNDHAGTTTRQAYDTLADGFGPGANGPLLLVVRGRRRRAGGRRGSRSRPPRGRRGDRAAGLAGRHAALLTVRADHQPAVGGHRAAGRHAARHGRRHRRARRRRDRGGGGHQRGHGRPGCRC